MQKPSAPSDGGQTKNNQQWQPDVIARKILLPLARFFENIGNGNSALRGMILLRDIWNFFAFEKVIWYFEDFKTPFEARMLVHRVTNIIKRYKALPLPKIPNHDIQDILHKIAGQRYSGLSHPHEQGSLILKKYELECQIFLKSEEYMAARKRAAEASDYLRQLASMILGDKEVLADRQSYINYHTGITGFQPFNISPEPKTDTLREPRNNGEKRGELTYSFIKHRKDFDGSKKADPLWDAFAKTDLPIPGKHFENWEEVKKARKSKGGMTKNKYKTVCDNLYRDRRRYRQNCLKPSDSN